jgi:hypothetical protein
MPIVNGHHPCEEDGVGAEGDGVLDFEPLEDNRVDFSLVEGRGWQVRWRAVHGQGGTFQEEQLHVFGGGAEGAEEALTCGGLGRLPALRGGWKAGAVASLPFFIHHWFFTLCHWLLFSRLAFSP